jgi:LacI family transcriptional regulator
MVSNVMVAEVERTSAEPLYLQVKDFLKKEIHRGKFRPGDRLPSQRTLAGQAKVSQLTVQKAVSSLVEEGLLVARQGQGTFIRDGAAAMAKPRTGVYATIVPSIRANTVASFVYALDDRVFAESGHHMYVCNSRLDLDREVTLLDSLLDRSTDALIYALNPLLYRRPVFRRAIEARLQAFLTAGVPVVMIDRYMEPNRYDTVHPDKDRMAELQIEHLLELGHRRLLFVGFTDISAEIVGGWGRAIERFGLQEHEARMLLTDCDGIDEGVDRELNRVLSEGRPFTAIVAATDTFGLACYRWLKARGIHCPDDVSIIGADNLEELQAVDFHLTTVWSEPNEIARHVQRLIEKRTGHGDLSGISPEEIRIEPKLAPRASTAPPATARGRHM